MTDLLTTSKKFGIAALMTASALSTPALAQDPLTISAGDLLQNGGNFKMAIEAGGTIADFNCVPDIKNSEDVTCKIDIVFGRHNIAITDEDGNINSKGLDGKKPNKGHSMKATFDFDEASGVLQDINIDEATAKARFISVRQDKIFYRAVDESTKAYDKEYERVKPKKSQYTLEASTLSPVELAMQKENYKFYNGSLRPIDHYYYVSAKENGVSQTMIGLIDPNEKSELDKNNNDAKLALGLKREYNDQGKYGMVKTTISLYGIVKGGKLVSDSFSFSHDMGARPDDNIDYNFDEGKRKEIEDAVKKRGDNMFIRF